MSNEAPIIVGLDIGTTKIAAIAGRKNEQGKLEIIGFGKAQSNGVQHGQVLNIDLTIKAINTALQNCYNSNPDLEINEVYVGIAGHHIKSLQTRGDIVRHDPETEINKAEIDHLIANQRKTFIPAGDQIIDVIPQEFQIDNLPHIKDPVGYNGVKVGANFHIITGDKHAIRNINRSIDRCGLTVKDLVLQPLASAAAVISDVDLEAGVVILDIGGGTSDLAIFHDGILKHTAVIPFGGENITNDIRMGTGVLKSQAEAMKKQFGSALSTENKNNTFITIPSIKGMPKKEVSVKLLSKIIESRMVEILEFVSYHLKQVSLDSKQLNGGIILTGGGSQLKHLIQLTEYCTGLNARIGLPTEHLAPDHIEELKKPMYSTCLGLILKGYSDYENKHKQFAEQFKRVEVPKSLKNETASQNVTPQTPLTTPTHETTTPASINEASSVNVKDRKRKLSLWDKMKDSFKTNIVELFKEEEDKML
jgi:cell division protein FtsA